MRVLVVFGKWEWSFDGFCVDFEEVGTWKPFECFNRVGEESRNRNR